MSFSFIFFGWEEALRGEVSADALTIAIKHGDEIIPLGNCFTKDAVGDVHYDAALHHLGKTALQPLGALSFNNGQLSHSDHLFKFLLAIISRQNLNINLVPLRCPVCWGCIFLNF
ncbi:hypothetical protein APY94_05370 [Thermococcus celericrescens]|uniref:Uncharacterized protein n=1 Tax=Thermococcus celericrescens TaxID=227598 RepID=A0A100XY97_9EURY|nr:hypothetical protein APY94_05370 [Thermococcus celericrescens]